MTIKMAITSLLARSLEASRRVKKLLLFVAILYASSLSVGYWMSLARVPLAAGFKETVLETVATQQPFTTVLAALRENLPLAIALTFFTNLTVGAFATTTLPGVAPLLGILGTSVITIFRGWTIGLVYYEIFEVSLSTTMVAVGTMILELGAYVFSAAAGIDISLAPVFPERYDVNDRLEAFKRAWKNTSAVYVIVVILLAVGAIWEMLGLYLLIH